MSNMNPFQVFLLLFFAALALGGVIFFAAFRGLSGNSESVGRVVIWGTVNQSYMDDLLGTLRQRSRDFGGLSYTQKDARTFSQEYITALAEGTGPNLILLPHDLIYVQRSTITPIPFSAYPERTFKDTFIEGAELYLRDEGVYGIPFSLDPFVMYWNRTLLTNKGFAQAPKYWDEIFSSASRITEKDAVLNIRKSAIALGEFSNIAHAKDILSALFLQAGTPITQINTNTGTWGSALTYKGQSETVPAQDALRFFTEFSNPTKAAYSWNKSLPEAKQAFANGDLALYLGYASEASDIQKANPNLNFDIAPFPQTRGDETQSVYARFTAFALPRGGTNVAGALAAAYELTSAQTLNDFVGLSGLPPVRRDLLTVEPQDPYLALFYKAAILSEAWFDPSPEESATIFRAMTDSVTTGKNTITEAVNNGSRQLGALFK